VVRLIKEVVENVIEQDAMENVIVIEQDADIGNKEVDAEHVLLVAAKRVEVLGF
jgi:hypothetical protein